MCSCIAGKIKAVLKEVLKNVVKKLKLFLEKSLKSSCTLAAYFGVSQ